MGGVNLYNFIWIVQDLPLDLSVSIIPNIILAIAILLLLWRFGRKGPLLEAILAFMLASFLFGRVLNEQFLVSIFPLILALQGVRLQILDCTFHIHLSTITILLLSRFQFFGLVRSSIRTTFKLIYMWCNFKARIPYDTVLRSRSHIFSAHLMESAQHLGRNLSQSRQWTASASLMCEDRCALNPAKQTLALLFLANFAFFSGSRPRSRTWRI